MILTVPVYKAIKWMVWDEQGPLRGFSSQEDARHFVGDDTSLKIIPIPKKFKQIIVEEAPF